jgi:hypothetical protein
VRYILDCLCNSRIVQPRYAGHVATWPLLLIWGGMAVLAVSGCLVFVAHRRRRPPDPVDWAAERLEVEQQDVVAEHAEHAGRLS